MNDRWSLRLIMIAIIALVAGIAVVDHLHVGVFHDDSMYVILAKSLATGQGYRYLNLPGQPVASHFPPGYPLLLALVWKIAPGFPANVIAFKVVNVLLFVASAVLIAQLARERLGNARTATILGVLSAVSVPSLVLVSMVLSEPLFLALVLTILLLAERAALRSSASRDVAVVGLLVGAATLVRAHGIVLLPAIALPLLVQKRWKDVAILFGCAAICIALWQLWSSAHSSPLPAPLAGNYGSYISWWMRGFRDMGYSIIPATLERTIPDAGATFSALFSPHRGEHWHLATRYGLVAIAIVGSIMLARRAPITLCFIIFYSTVVALWPFPPSRFAWGAWPIVLFVIVTGIYAIFALDWGRIGWVRYGVAGVAMWLTIGYAEYEWRAMRGAWWGSISRSSDPRIAAAIDWTLRHTRPSDVVAADDEAAVYLYTGRTTVPVASFTTAHYLMERTDETEAREGLMPILGLYPVSVVLVGSQRTFAAAQYLTVGPAPLLALRDQFADGAAFTVLRR